MSMSYADRTRVSHQAFQEQVSNWELTLNRQQKKMKNLRAQIRSKIHLNELDIIVTQIEAEMIRYRKLMDPKKIQTIDIIQQYNTSSRKFMDLMENIGAFADKIDEANNQNTLQFDSQELQLPYKTMQNVSVPHYHNQTFTYAISKEAKFSQNKSINASKSHISHKNSFNKQNKSMNLISGSKSKKKQLSNNNIKQNFFSGGQQGSGEDIDAWQIRYQLKQIKSMMSQIRNEIKFHNHEDVEAELAKIQHNNKKMSLQLKSLREDNQYINARMQKLKEELAGEKQIQAQMIQEFQNPRRSRKSKGKGASETQNCSLNQQVSDWVRVRI